MLHCLLPGPPAPSCRRLDNVSGTDASTGAETLLDVFQGMWYSCTFRLQGTPSGVDLEQRVCVPTSSLTPGVSVPNQLNAMQVLTVITVRATSDRRLSRAATLAPPSVPLPDPCPIPWNHPGSILVLLCHLRPPRRATASAAGGPAFRWQLTIAAWTPSSPAPTLQPPRPRAP